MAAIRENKTSQVRNPIVIIANERPSRFQSYLPDFMGPKFGTPGGSGIERRRVDYILDCQGPGTRRPA